MQRTTDSRSYQFTLCSIRRTLLDVVDLWLSYKMPLSGMNSRKAWKFRTKLVSINPISLLFCVWLACHKAILLYEFQIYIHWLYCCGAENVLWQSSTMRAISRAKCSGYKYTTAHRLQLNCKIHGVVILVLALDFKFQAIKLQFNTFPAH